MMYLPGATSLVASLVEEFMLVFTVGFVAAFAVEVKAQTKFYHPEITPSSHGRLSFGTV